MSAFMVEARDVKKSISNLDILRGVDFTVARGEVVSLIGPSGSGKSTFLRCINHLTQITGGYLSVDGELVGYRREGDKLYELGERETAAKRAEIGMVFQRFNLFAHKTAIENIIEAPVQVKGEKRKAATEHARSLLEKVGLAHKADAYPSELSGGQQQRIAIARALAMRPKLMLFDEPTSALDPRTGRRGPRGHAQARLRRHDHDRRDARDELRPRCLRPRRLHGRGTHRRMHDAGRTVRFPPYGTRAQLPLARSLISPLPAWRLNSALNPASFSCST